MTRGISVLPNVRFLSVLGVDRGPRDAQYAGTAVPGDISQALHSALRLALALAALACGSPAYTTVDATTGQPRAAMAASDEQLVYALESAREEWAYQGVTEQAHVAFIRYVDGPVAMTPLCGEPQHGNRGLGCWVGQTNGIYILRGLTPQREAEVVLHELGHALRQDGRHLDCPGTPGASVMCTGGSLDMAVTPADVAFVTRAL